MIKLKNKFFINKNFKNKFLRQNFNYITQNCCQNNINFIFQLLYNPIIKLNNINSIKFFINQKFLFNLIQQNLLNCIINANNLNNKFKFNNNNDNNNKLLNQNNHLIIMQFSLKKFKNFNYEQTNSNLLPIKAKKFNKISTNTSIKRQNFFKKLFKLFNTFNNIISIKISSQTIILFNNDINQLNNNFNIKAELFWVKYSLKQHLSLLWFIQLKVKQII